MYMVASLLSSILASMIVTGTGCSMNGTWHGHPHGGAISSVAIAVVQTYNGSIFATNADTGELLGSGHVTNDIVHYNQLVGQLTANIPYNASAPPCTRLNWKQNDDAFWCREPFCEPVPPPSPVPAPPPPPIPTPGKKLPNIIFIITDDQDTALDSISAMPTLRRVLVEGGTSFSNFFVDVPVCCPSRTSFLSGRMAHNNGAMGIARNTRAPGGWCGNGIFWKGPKMNQTVATYMKNAGYRTGIFGKELNSVEVGHRSPGWDKYYALVDECKYFGNSFVDDGLITKVDDSVYMTTAIGTASLSWMASLHERNSTNPWPFFAYIGFHAPHQPAQPDIMYETEFSNMSAPRTPAWNYSAQDHHWLVSMQQPLTDLDADESDEMFRRRWRTLISVDDYLAKLVGQLESWNELDRTYILYSSDHGYHLGQWRIPAHKELPYDTDLRVPFFIRGPGVAQNRVVDAIGVNIDVAVTIADLAGYKIPAEAQVDGKSLAPLVAAGSAGRLAEATWPRTEFIFEHEGGNINPSGVPRGVGCGTAWMRPGGKPIEGYPLCKCGNPMQHWISSSNNTYKGIRLINATANYKLVRFDDNDDYHELFDMSKDPAELHNIINSAPAEIVSYLKARLTALRGCGASSNTIPCP